MIATVNTAMIPAARRAVSESWSIKRAVSGTLPGPPAELPLPTGAWAQPGSRDAHPRSSDATIQTGWTLPSGYRLEIPDLASHRTQLHFGAADWERVLVAVETADISAGSAAS